MASYTDIAPKFSPYVAHQDTDLMLKVGMAKQAQYQQGYEKIQSSIDQIAGLDIYNDVDKQYLQDKLNNLGNKLTAVAAGDFSNFQLTNSISGLAKEIGNDKLVQNAVVSTAKLKKDFEAMEAAKKAGKSGASNEWEFQQGVQQYAQSTAPGSKYTGEYNQYSDYMKKAQEVIKGLVKNEQIQDVAFEMDANGNPTGRILDAITRKEISGVEAERIQQALSVGLSTDDYRQMSRDGRYNYSNVSKEEFTGSYTKGYNTSKEQILSQRKILSDALTKTNSVAERTKLKEGIESTDRNLANLTTKYNEILKQIENGGLEEAKGTLFTTKWMSDFANTFAYHKLSSTFESSPFLAAQQFRETKALDWKKYIMSYNQNQAFHDDDQAWKRLNYDLDVKKTEIAAIAAGAKAGKYGSLEGGVPFVVDKSTLPDVTISKINSAITADENAINSADAQIMKDFSGTINGKADIKDKNWLNQQHAAWQTSKKSVDPALAAHFRNTEEKRRSVAENTAMLSTITTEADRKYNVKSLIPQGSKNLTVRLANNKAYVYSPEELVEFNNTKTKYIITKNVGGTNVITWDDARAVEDLSPKELYLYNAAKSASSMYADKNPAYKIVRDNLNYYMKKVNIPQREMIKERSKFISDSIIERTSANQSVTYNASIADKEDENTMKGNLSSWAKKADLTKGLPYSPGVTGDDIRAIAANLDAVTVNVREATEFMPARYELTATDKKGGHITFAVPTEDYISVFGNTYSVDKRLTGMERIDQQMQKGGKGNTTALDGQRTNISNADLGHLDFENIELYGVSGNVIRTSDNKYSLRLNIVDPATKKIVEEDFPYPTSGNLPRSNVMEAINGLNDNIIYSLIHGRMPTQKELSDLAKASKTP